MRIKKHLHRQQRLRSGLGNHQGPGGQGLADLFAFGRPFIANPDFVERLKKGAPLNEWDKATFYGGGAKGYTDYPTLQKADAAE